MSLFSKGQNSAEHTEKKPENVQIQSAETPRTETRDLGILALSLISDGVLLVDKDNLIRMINPAAAQMAGLASQNDAMGLDVEMSLKFNDVNGNAFSKDSNPVLHALSTNQKFESRELLITPKNSDKLHHVKIEVIPTGDENSDRIVTLRNIDKDIEEETAQSDFISTASHEMRTPVASIEGYLSLALNPQTATIDNRARQYLMQARESSKHLGQLFQDLLDVTKLDDKKIMPRPTPIELGFEVRGILKNFLPLMAQKKLRLEFGTKKGEVAVHKVQPPVYAFLDVSFLKEIVGNLIDNAIKYTPEGGTIWVNVTAEDNRCMLEITDSGIGIPGEDLKHIFQKFYRVDNSQTRALGGTGLGLYLVHQRVEAMGGKTWAESVYGSGTSFFVTFPRISSEDYEKLKINQQNAEKIDAQKHQSMLDSIREAKTTQTKIPDASAKVITKAQSLSPNNENV